MYRHEQYEDFMAAQARAMEINGQNARFDRIDAEIDDDDFRAMAREGIADEQDDLLLDLLERSDNLPYGDLHADGQRLEDELAEAAERLATISDEEDAKKTHYLELAKKVAELAPRREHEADELAADRIAHLDSLNREALRERIAAIKADIEGYNLLFEEVGAAWPLPRAVMATTFAETYFVDEVPLPPRIHDSTARLQRIRERNVDAPEASQWVTLYLADKSRQSVTVDELVTLLYEAVEAERDNGDLRSRVTTTLGPKIHGKRIRKMLAEEGFALQYGFRTYYEKRPDGSVKQVARHRIYRAIPLEEATEEEYTESFTSVLDEHNNTVDLVAEQTSHGKVIQAIGRVAIESVSFVPPADVRPVPSPRQIKEFLDRKKAGQPQPEVPGAGSEPAPAEPLPQQEQDRQEPAPASRRTRREKAPRKSWKDDFKHTVGEHIQKLHEEHLLCEEPKTSRTVGKMSHSTIMATDTAMQRLVDAKLMSLADKESGFVTAQQILLMSLYNTNRDLFSVTARRRQAVKIVEDCLAAYFEHQREND